MTILNEFQRDAEGVLDRLVDGELGLDERRELLAALDDEPSGWRRCALAFLEAQSWRWQMSRAATEPILAQVAVRPNPHPARRRGYWAGLLAIAAGLFVAFALGTRFSTNGPATETLAIHEGKAPEGPETRDIARPDSSAAANELAGADDEAAESPDVPWQTVTLTPLGDDGSGDPFQLRVTKDTSAEKPPATSARSALSTLLSGLFEQQGWRVNRQQRYVPIDLSDGRRLVVPIEEVELSSPDGVQF